MDTLLGALQRGVGQPATLELAHLAAQDLIVDAVRAGERDVANIHAIAWVDEEGERHFVGRVVGRRDRLDFGERITVAPQAVLDELLGGGDELAIEDLAGLHEEQAFELFLRDHERAGQFDFADIEDITFLHVDGDEDIFLLGGDRDLRGLDVEVRITPIHVEVADLLQVALQGLARIAVVLLVPGQPVGRLQLQGVEDFLLLVSRVADQVDLANFGPLAFLDFDLDLDAVAGFFVDFCVDAHAVLAAAEVLVGEVLGDILEHRAVEGLAGGEADVAQGLLQILRLDVLVAGDLEALDGGTLQHHDHQGAAFAAHLYVTEEIRGIQRTDRLTHALRGQVIADVHREVVVDGSFGDALQSLDLDVAYSEVRFARRSSLCRLRGLSVRQRSVHKQCDRDHNDATLHASTTSVLLCNVFTTFIRGHRTAARCQASTDPRSPRAFN